MAHKTLQFERSDARLLYSVFSSRVFVLTRHQVCTDKDTTRVTLISPMKTCDSQPTSCFNMPPDNRFRASITNQDERRSCRGDFPVHRRHACVKELASSKPSSQATLEIGIPSSCK